MAATKAALRRAQEQADRASPAAVQAGAAVLRDAMIRGAPRDTGALAGAISTEVSSLGEGAVARTGSSAEYDRFVQRGTRNMGADPYGERAGDQATDAIASAMAAIYRAAVKG